MSLPAEQERFLSNQQLAARYGVSLRALHRWISKPELNFPPAYDFSSRPYRKLSEIEAWERARALIPASNRTPRNKRIAHAREA
jgi:predicted DNA-binding transcriptional regulator AlpA